MSETTDLIRDIKSLTKEFPTSSSLRLARVCEILLEQHPERPCHQSPKDCAEQFGHSPAALLIWCQPCRDRALLAECDRAARGER